MSVDYLDTPAVAPRGAKQVVTTLRNPHPDAFVVRCSIQVPAGWTAPAEQSVELQPGGEAQLTWTIRVPARHALDNSNRLFLVAQATGRPAAPAVPIVLLGGAACRISGPHPRDGRSDEELLAESFTPKWREIVPLENELPLAGEFDEPGVLLVQKFVEAPAEQEIWLVVDANCPVRYSVNGVEQKTAHRYRGVRPNYGGTADSAGQVTLRAGFNEIVVQLVRDADAPPVECHIALASSDKFRAGQPHLGQTRFPWDASR